MKYKASMFNFVFDEGEELVLFNSMKGMWSACRVRREDREQVKNLLVEQKTGIEVSEKEEIPELLVERGFLVNDDLNEKQQREASYSRFVDRNANNLNLIILPTEQCNYRCKYCYESFQKGKMTEELQEAVIKYIRKNISKYAGLRISWFGGEPLLALDVIEKISVKAMDICKRARRAYRADMTTNGYLLTLETFKKLLSWNVLSYQITVDGIKEIHDSKKPLANGAGTFDVVTGNLKRIKEEIKSSVFHIMIRSNVTADALVSMDEFTTFFHEMLGDDKRFSFFMRAAGDWGGNNRLDEMTQKRISEDQIGTVYQNFAKMGYQLNVGAYAGFYNPGGCMCYATMLQSFVISSDGNVRKCTCELDDERYSIGRLLPNGNMELDDEKMNRWFGNTVRFSEKCDNCAFSPLCFGACCPRINIYDRPEGSKANPRCPVEMEDIKATFDLLESRERFPYINERMEAVNE